MKMIDPFSLCHAYLDAKRCLIQLGFAGEIDWQATAEFERVTEQQFLREYAWVVLNAGFREQTVRRLFPDIEKAFCGWASAGLVWSSRKSCQRSALVVFRNRRKITAILNTCRIIADRGFFPLRVDILSKGPLALLSLPFMGPATSLHLAKNLGIDVVKPDRHLKRIASATGFSSPQQMCKTIQTVVGDSLREIDVVIWRFATLNPTWSRHLESEFRLKNDTTFDA